MIEIKVQFSKNKEYTLHYANQKYRPFYIKKLLSTDVLW